MSESKAIGKNLIFHWKYVILPGALLLFSVVLAAFFYHLLPPEVAYHFAAGAPDGWLGRNALVAWLIAPQFMLFFIGMAMSWGTAFLGARIQPGESARVNKAYLIMGNMVVLPQVILVFAMLDIFLYNSYRIHILPLWVFALIVIAAGSIVLGIFFIQALRQSHRLSG